MNISEFLKEPKIGQSFSLDKLNKGTPFIDSSKSSLWNYFHSNFFYAIIDVKIGIITTLFSLGWYPNWYGIEMVL